MNKQPQERDLRKHFESILGHELGDLEGGVVVVREKRAVWLETAEENGNVMSREIGTTGNSTKACGRSMVVTIGGLTGTGPDGKAEFLLSEYHCGLEGEPEFPFIFVATAQSNQPVFVTSRTFEVYAEGTGRIIDIKVEIYTWAPGGNPAGSTLVNWLCQFPVEEVIF